jgi:hypothetical protein
MKKFLVSVGLAAAGTASLHATYAPELGSFGATKMWSISADLRGFYDDNYTTGANKTGSYGFEFSPQLELTMPMQQTELGMRYTYGLYYFQQREELGVNAFDQSHDLDLWLDHAFSPRWEVRMRDTFIVGQEPALLNPNPAVTQPYRVAGNNIVNTASINLSTVWTPRFSTSLTYNNTLTDYENSGAGLDDLQPTGPLLPLGGGLYILNPFVGSAKGDGPSLAGVNNRVDQSVSLDFQWLFATETLAFFGVQFEQVNYIADEPVAFNLAAEEYYLLYGKNNPSLGPVYYYSSDRDNRSYTAYIGFTHSLLPNLNISAKAGAQYSETYNDPLSSPSIGPYAVMSAVYTYRPGSYVQIGFSQMLNATDVVAPDPTSGKLTLDQESSVAFAAITHRLTPKLSGTVIGNWQYSTFQEGEYSGAADISYTLSANLSYSFSPHFSASAGYNFYDLQSNIYQRGYSRNQVYIDVWAAY